MSRHLHHLTNCPFEIKKGWLKGLSLNWEVILLIFFVAKRYFFGRKRPLLCGGSVLLSRHELCRIYALFWSDFDADFYADIEDFVQIFCRFPCFCRDMSCVAFTRYFGLILMQTFMQTLRILCRFLHKKMHGGTSGPHFHKTRLKNFQPWIYDFRNEFVKIWTLILKIKTLFFIDINVEINGDVICQTSV